MARVKVSMTLLRTTYRHGVMMNIPRRPSKRRVSPIMRRTHRHPNNNRPFQFLTKTFLPRGHLTRSPRRGVVEGRRPITRRRRGRTRSHRVSRHRGPLTSPTSRRRVSQHTRRRNSPRQRRRTSGIINRTSRVSSRLSRSRRYKRRCHYGGVLSHPLFLFIRGSVPPFSIGLCCYWRSRRPHDCGLQYGWGGHGSQYSNFSLCNVTSPHREPTSNHYGSRVAARTPKAILPVCFSRATFTPTSCTSNMPSTCTTKTEGTVVIDTTEGR